MKTTKEIEKTYLAMFDELNVIISGLYAYASLTEMLENVENLMINAFTRGFSDAYASLGYEVANDIKESDIKDTLNRPVGGMSYVNRLVLAYETDTEAQLRRLIESEIHRAYNEGSLKAAEMLERYYGATIMKEWHTVLDDKVRESHQFLEGYQVALDEYFYTYGGKKALYPGGFGDPSEDTNCRCILIYKEV